MVKVKRVRTIDCVVAGWRPGKEEGTVGSLMLGLYDEKGELHVIGHTSGFKAKEKRARCLAARAYETGERGSADPSRWSADRDLEWVSLRPELVVEVSFDHVSAGRIRHGAKIERWREDKDPAQLHARSAEVATRPRAARRDGSSPLARGTGGPGAVELAVPRSLHLPVAERRDLAKGQELVA